MTYLKVSFVSGLVRHRIKVEQNSHGLESLGLQGDPTSPSKGDQSWVFIGRTDAEADTPILWPPHAKS